MKYTEPRMICNLIKPIKSNMRLWMEYEKRVIADEMDEYQDSFDIDLRRVSLESNQDWRFRRCIHYFLPCGMARFLESSVRSVDPRAYLRDIPDGGTVVDRSCGEGDSGRRWLGVFIHFPTSEMDHSMYVQRRWGDESSACYCYGNQVGYMDSSASAAKNGPGASDSPSKILLGFSLYCDAFPGLIRPALRDEVKRRGHYKGRAQVLGMNAEAGQDCESSVSPHFRRGHFRVLKSDRYTQKRFQTVFVKGCFVNGTAKDVSDREARALPAA